MLPRSAGTKRSTAVTIDPNRVYSWEVAATRGTKQGPQSERREFGLVEPRLSGLLMEVERAGVPRLGQAPSAFME